jgi:hypothetical protein
VPPCAGAAPPTAAFGSKLPAAFTPAPGCAAPLVVVAPGVCAAPVVVAGICVAALVCGVVDVAGVCATALRAPGDNAELAAVEVEGTLTVDDDLAVDGAGVGVTPGTCTVVPMLGSVIVAVVGELDRIAAAFAACDGNDATGAVIAPIGAPVCAVIATGDTHAAITASEIARSSLFFIMSKLLR